MTKDVYPKKKETIKKNWKINKKNIRKMISQKTSRKRKIKKSRRRKKLVNKLKSSNKPKSSSLVSF